MNKKYTAPKIYHGGRDFDLSKRWYVYFSYEHPTEKDSSGNPKMKRQTPIMLQVNRKYKTKKERLFHLELIRETIHEMLKNGYTPYEVKKEISSLKYTAEAALDFAFSLKEKSVGTSTAGDYRIRLSKFKRYLDGIGMLGRNITEVDKRIVNDYLNTILKESGPRNRNNHRSVLSSLFGVLEDNEMIPRNFIHSIKKLKSKPKRNKTYSLEVVEGLYSFLDKKDPQLLFFIKMVSYNFLRPIEVCRLQMKDINLSQKVLHVRAKNKLVKTKIIPDLMLPELEKLDFSNAEHYLVTPTGVGAWEATETNRRDYFSKQFNKTKKMYDMHLKELGETLQLGQDHTIYSFRHTFITKLYRQLRKEFSTTETYDRVMLITGHSTLDALKAYLRDIDAELPEDYSGYLN